MPEPVVDSNGTTDTERGRLRTKKLAPFVMRSFKRPARVA